MNRFVEVVDKPASWYSVRSWLMRVGYYELHREKPQADDWLWIIDHSLQLSHEKCFVIVGVRQSDLEAGHVLCHHDLSLVSLEVVRESNGGVVFEQLESAVSKTGVPRAIIHDHGSELKSGVSQFQAIHPETASVYDIKHRLALDLKHELCQDSQWQAFTEVASTIDKRLRQTAYAHLVPPKLRLKARYMNLGSRVKWANKVLALLTCSPADEELQERVGRLTVFREDIERWSGLLAIIGTVEDYCRKQGVSEAATRILSVRLAEQAHQNKRVLAFQQAVLTFIEEQSAVCRAGEHLRNSSEVLESLFGKQKYLEHEHAKRGFSGLILAIGAMVNELSASFIQEALEASPVKQVRQWYERYMRQTLQARQVATNQMLEAEQKTA